MKGKQHTPSPRWEREAQDMKGYFRLGYFFMLQSYCKKSLWLKLKWSRRQGGMSVQYGGLAMGQSVKGEVRTREAVPSGNVWKGLLSFLSSNSLKEEEKKEEWMWSPQILEVKQVWESKVTFREGPRTEWAVAFSTSCFYLERNDWNRKPNHKLRLMPRTIISCTWHTKVKSAPLIPLSGISAEQM